MKIESRMQRTGTEGLVENNKAFMHPQRPAVKIDRRVGFAIVWILLTIIFAAVIYLAAFGPQQTPFFIP